LRVLRITELFHDVAHMEFNGALSIRQYNRNFAYVFPALTHLRIWRSRATGKHYFLLMLTIQIECLQVRLNKEAHENMADIFQCQS
jgi:hypothetical protein